MPYYRFIGDPIARRDNPPGNYQANDPKSIVLGGLKFKLDGDAVEVKDKTLCARLDGNRHFEKVDGRTVAAGGRNRSKGDAGGDAGKSSMAGRGDPDSDDGGNAAESSQDVVEPPTT